LVLRERNARLQAWWKEEGSRVAWGVVRKNGSGAWSHFQVQEGGRDVKGGDEKEIKMKRHKRKREERKYRNSE
jgi:hypothetical protein